MISGKSELITDFFKKHWFQIGLMSIGIFISWVIYSALVLEPERVREQETARQEAAQLAVQTKEEVRQENLEKCLKESEYERESSHLALCGDPNVGRSQKKCARVFGGATSLWDAFANYASQFGTTTIDNDLNSFQKFVEECNCGLEKSRGDELDREKTDRDSLCLAKYGR